MDRIDPTVLIFEPGPLKISNIPSIDDEGTFFFFVLLFFGVF